VCGRGRRGGGEGRGGIDTPEEGDGEEEVARAGAALTKHDTPMCFRICFQFPDACEEEDTCVSYVLQPYLLPVSRCLFWISSLVFMVGGVWFTV